MVNLVNYLFHQGNRNEIEYDLLFRDRRIRWCHVSTIPGTTPHCLVITEENVNSLRTYREGPSLYNSK